MESIIEQIRNSVPIQDCLEKARNGGYCCPWCGSGTGRHGTGAVKVYSDGRIYCHACGRSGDVLDVYQTIKGCSLQEAIRDLGQKVPADRKESRPTKKEVKEPEPLPDWSGKYQEWAGSLEQTQYHRGISLETLRRYRVGYCPEWVNPKRPDTSPSPRLIIPVGKSHYLARYAGSGDHPYEKIYVGENRPCFNMAALRQESPCFIVEGEIDALSIIDAGRAAVGLGSGKMVGRFLEAVRENPPKCRLILSLDTDKPGRDAQSKLADGLKQMGIPFSVGCPLPAGCKDPNELLMKDRKEFDTWIHEAEERQSDYEGESCLAFLDSIRAEIGLSEAFSSTGFPLLDNVLGGGLFEGLYVIGAVSSLGKTTFALQIADQVAKAGKDVLVFSLEMSRRELVCKSISRLSGTHSTRDVMTAKYSGDAWEQYRDFAGRLFVVEGMGNVTIDTIRKRVNRHIAETGRRPLVIVDYLQIISPFDARATDKQNTDHAILELKRISRDNKIPVIAISSFNRENYTAPVNMTAFKESGAVEYSSDVLIGLQYSGMDYQEGESEKDRGKRIRELVRANEQAGRQGNAVTVQLKILKNRNGCRGESFYEFFPKFNRFSELMGTPEARKDIDDLLS